MGQQDAQQVCLNGHQITDSYHYSPDFRQRHCSQCGAETIHKCQSCGTEIRGDYHVDGFFALGDSTPVPTNCEGCGAQFPWTRKKQELATAATDPSADGFKLLEHICSRFHLVAKQLRTRHADRDSLIVADEYDVQDLLHALLRVHFDDIRPEEWTPSYAGSSSRVDFLLKEEQIIVEVKKTRESLKARHVGEQLIIDIERYRAHPDCKKLICFVYDPEGWVNNPRGLESDLNRKDEDLEVKVLIVPKGH
ncbi:DUF2321 domain-containing protein [Pseudomonas chlororaphis]|uniref:DUF2321 domain-containing protein n=1 Tax=Pseudomonas chlororaphis TaxID=587753 RepID=UPI0014748051|nr:DUF2321 domain-containing protein [Pseudomonas chlororaphis]NNB42270.1 DUF2321 domain-containing protein [Pseudomonas chlororaphis]